VPIAIKDFHGGSHNRQLGRLLLPQVEAHLDTAPDDGYSQEVIVHGGGLALKQQQSLI